MRFKVANYSRLEIRLDTLHIYTMHYAHVLTLRDLILHLRAVPGSDLVSNKRHDFVLKTRHNREPEKLHLC